MTSIPRKMDLEKSFMTFSHEVKDFYKAKTITCVTWCTFWLINISNIITIIYSAAPGWAWTQEMVGGGSNSNNLEGEVYGFYGLWYMCWDQVVQFPGTEKRTCLLWVSADDMPDWFPAFQAMMTMTFIFGFLSFMLIGFYMFAKTLNRNFKFIMYFVASTFMAVACSVTGFVIFVILFLQDAYWCCHPDLERELIQAELSWCFILCCVGTGLYMFAGVGGIFEAMDILKERRIEEEFEAWRKREAELELNGTYDPYMMGYMNPMMPPGSQWR